MDIFKWFRRPKPEFHYLRMRLMIVHDEIAACSTLVDQFAAHAADAVKAAVDAGAAETALAISLQAQLDTAAADAATLKQKLADLVNPPAPAPAPVVDPVAVAPVSP